MSHFDKLKGRAKDGIEELLTDDDTGSWVIKLLRKAMKGRHWKESSSPEDPSKLVDLLIGIADGSKGRDDQEDGLFEAAMIINDMYHYSKQNEPQANKISSDKNRALKKLMGWVCVAGLNKEKLEQLLRSSEDESTYFSSSGSKKLYIADIHKDFSHLVAELFLASQGLRWSNLHPSDFKFVQKKTQSTFKLSSRTLCHISIEGGTPEGAFCRIFAELWKRYFPDEIFELSPSSIVSQESQRHLQRLNTEITIHYPHAESVQCVVEMITLEDDPYIGGKLRTLLTDNLPKLGVLSIVLDKNGKDSEFLEKLGQVLVGFFKEEQSINPVIVQANIKEKDQEGDSDETPDPKMIQLPGQPDSPNPSTEKQLSSKHEDPKIEEMEKISLFQKFRNVVLRMFNP